MFSPDGVRILTASADKTAKLWNTASGKLIACLAHQDRINNVVFRPDGARILTASWDKTAQLWDEATPTELARRVREPGGDNAGRGSSDSTAGSRPLQIESLSDLASGLQFANDGSLVIVNEERRSQLTKQFQDLGQDFRPDARFTRWFFGAGHDRTIFPASDVKVADWVDNALLTNLDRALLVDATAVAAQRLRHRVLDATAP